MQDKDFKFTYTAPAPDERREIEGIRNRYLPPDERAEKMARLRALDRRARRPPFFAALGLGAGGTLLFGLGMSMVLEWGLFVWGVLTSVLGAGMAALAYPAGKFLRRRCREKYAPEILALSEELTK